MAKADGEAGDLADIGREALTTRFGDKLSKADERRGDLLIFKVRVLHTAFLSLLEIHNFQVSQLSSWKNASTFLLSSFTSRSRWGGSKDGDWSLEDILLGGEGGRLDSSLHIHATVATAIESRES